VSPVSASSLADEILYRIAADLSLLLDRELVVEECSGERAERRAAGPGEVHVSFRFALVEGGGASQGCLLVPLKEAQTLAGLLRFLTDSQVQSLREADRPDDANRDAMLELATFFAGCVGNVLRESLPEAPEVHSAGCQGVRADVRPTLAYHEGDPLWVVRCRMSLADFGAFDLWLQLPEGALGAAAESPPESEV